MNIENSKLELLGITILMKLTVMNTESLLLGLGASIVGILCMVLFILLTVKQI